MGWVRVIRGVLPTLWDVVAGVWHAAGWKENALAHILLFHHALGLTDGVLRFAASLRRAGHVATVPDLYAGRTFADLTDGVAHAEAIGFQTLIDRGVACAADLDAPFVVAGFSLGVLPAQKLAQTDPGVVGAILYHAAVPAEMFGAGWPAGVALQLHFCADDPWAAEDLPAARALAAAAGGALFVHPGRAHLVAEVGHQDYDPTVAAHIRAATLAFLDDAAS